MKKIILFVTCLVVFAALTAFKTADLKITLSYLKDERSKDSNKTNITYILSERKLTYKYKNNRMAGGNEEITTAITEKQKEALVKLIHKKDLFRTIEAKADAQFEVPYTAILMKCEISHGSKKGNISTSCLTEETNKNKDYTAVETLRTELDKIIAIARKKK